jgi:CheY-like chemotaxis protein
MSRIVSGKLRLNMASTHLISVIEDALETIRPAAEAKGIRLELALDPDAGLILADSQRMQQVIWNLLSNAVMFTPSGGRVRVKLTRIDSQIEVAVSDTGQGISPDFLPYVFDRFRQGDAAMSRSYSGLGLGLAIVRHLVELHGGSVEAESPGKDRGATFVMKLPLMLNLAGEGGRRPVLAEEQAGNAQAPLRFERTDSLHGVRVLVVDDEPDTLILLSEVLSQSGASVRTALSAKEAFTELQAWRPQIILSDIGLPGEDGYSFMRRVRAWQKEFGGWIPAIALTGYARVEDRVKALASGYQIHLPKPVEPEELVAVIVSLVERPSTPRGV